MIKYFLSGNQITLLEDNSSLYMIMDVQIKLDEANVTFTKAKIEFVDVNIPFKYGNILKKGICKINNKLFICYAIALLKGSISDYDENKVKEVYKEVVEVLNNVM